MVNKVQVEALANLGKVFTPHQPIYVPEFLAGRLPLLFRAIDAANTEGLHIILYGDRGTGKTSVARVLAHNLQEQDDPYGRRCLLVSCSTSDTYASIWEKVAQEILLIQRQLGFLQHTVASVTGRVNLEGAIENPNHAKLFLQSLPNPTAIIIDEFDRIAADSDARRLMADTIKLFSDYKVRSTLFLVGVGESIEELIQEHQSVSRNIAQIRVDPMTPVELQEIIQKGFERVGLRFAHGLDERIAYLSQGYPHYTHLLGLWAGRRAVEENHTEVTFENLEKAIPQALMNAAGGLQHQYLKAIETSKKSALFKDVLLACALTEKDSLGRFPLGAVQEPLQRITGRAIATGAYQAHLARFTDAKRGPVLKRTGEKKSYRWRFVNPQLIPYIMLNGMYTGQLKLFA